MKKTNLLRLSIFAFSLIISLVSFASFDIFIQWQNGMEGETQDEHFRSMKASDAESFDFGAETDAIFGTSTKPAAGKARFKDVTITKVMDNASASLLQKLAEGNVLNSDVIIHIRRASAASADNGAAGVFCKIRLKNVIISDYHLVGTEGDDLLEETVKLTFGAAVVEYIPQNNKDGSDDTKNKKTFRWSVIRNDANVNE